MDLKTIRAALGELQHDPDNAEAWAALKEATSSQDEQHDGERRKLLAAARAAHAERREWHAVARLLAVELSLGNDANKLLPLWEEYAAVQSQNLLDETEATRAYARILELSPNHAAARVALAESEERRARWEELAVTYLEEADRAPDAVYKSSMLMRVAEMELRFGGDEVDPEIIEKRLTEACALDPNNQIAAEMLESLCRRSADWLTLANLLEGLLGQASNAKAKIVYGLKLARLYRNQLEDPEQATDAFKKVLGLAPTQAEAVTHLAEFYAASEAWPDLVSLYEQRLSIEDQRDLSRLGDMLQIAMLYYRKLGQPELAEPWFERVRRLDPVNAAALEFFRDYLGNDAGETRLLTILQAAWHAFPDGAEKQAIGRQMAALTEKHQGARKAIEQYKSLLRQDPNNAEVRDALKELYRKTGGHTALVELLRQQLERTPAGDGATRLELLREVAALYRDSIPSETALASVLSQIVAIDGGDPASVRELIGLYEKLGRFRELLSYQQRLAEISDDRQEKIEVLRATGRRWLEQFSNVQNATQTYEALLALEPRDVEAREQLRELYKKRRAWQPLFDLYAGEVEQKVGKERVQVLLEMAQLSAERLGQSEQAIKLYLQILELDPANLEVIDALERQAERSKDWPTLARALERRVEVLGQSAEQLAVLGKLGAVYSDHLNDSQGAIHAFRRVLEIQPGHQRALRVLRDIYLANGDYDDLEGLYAAQQDYEGLAEVFGNAAEKATDGKLRVELSRRAARIYRDNLAAPQRAFRAYERILATEPNNAEAASALLPIYEHEEKWGRIPALYETLIETTSAAREKFDYLRKAIQVVGQKLGDRAGSVAYARRAYELLPDEPESLELLEATAASAGHWQSVVDAIEARLTELSAAEPVRESGKGGRRKKAPAVLIGRELRLKLAQVHDERLQQTDSAVGLLKGILELAPSDEAASARLEAILRREHRRDDLRWLLELRVSHAPDDKLKVEILYQWAGLEAEVFLDSARAIALYRRVIEAEPEHLPALAKLTSLLLASGEHVEAAVVLESQVELLRGAERADALAKLGELYLGQLSRARDAFEVANQVLALSEHDARAISLLERLATVAELREQAAQVLATEYAKTGDARHEAEALQTLLASATLPHERFDLLLRLAAVQERKLDSSNAAFDTTLRAAREFPDKSELWEQAEVLAARVGRPTDLADALRETLSRLQGAEIEVALCERAAQLYQEKLGDPAGAIPYLERIIKREAGNERAFAELKRILTGQQRWAELAELYELVAGAVVDPAVQVELFAEAALVCEDITEDSAAAIKYYERILALDGYHEAALTALDRLYAKHERYENLTALLELRVERSAGDELLDLKNRLAALLLDKLHRPAEAIRHLEDVLGERIGDYEARKLAEQVLEIGSLRERAARLLETVYEARQEARELVGVLEIQLTAGKEALQAKPDDRERSEQYRELLRRIATLKDSRLHDDDGAFRALSEYVPLEPLDVAAREQIRAIGERLGAFVALAAVLHAAAEACDVAAQRAELLYLTARIHDEQLRDLEQSQAGYRRVLELEQEAPDLAILSARALEQVYVRTGQTPELAASLRTQIRLSSSEEERSNLQGRLANLLEVAMSDSAGAIEVWSSRLESDPLDFEALTSLERLYESNQRWNDLVQILRLRQDRAESATERKELRARMAGILAEKLGDLDGAILAWREVLDDSPGDLPAIAALEDLYRRAQRWDDLADAYQSHLELPLETGERLALWVKLGDLRCNQLGNAASALAAYSEALGLDSAFAPSRRALEKLLTDEDVSVRHEAARTLRKIYEAEHDPARLLQVLEIEIATSDDLSSKLELLGTASRVADSEHRDPSRALDYVKQAVSTARAHADLGPWLAELERLSASTGQRAEQVSLLRKTVDDIFDGGMKYSVTLSIARLGRDALGDQEIAREYFEKALELEPEGAEPLSALDALYESTGKHVDLLRILERRIEITRDVPEQKALMFRRAKLFVSDLNDRTRAIEAYEAIVDIDLDSAAVEALEGLYIGEGRFAALIALYERELDADPRHAADYRVKIAKILTDQFDDKARAFDELEAAIAVDKGHVGAISELQRFLEADGNPEFRARAAEVLEPIYLARADYDKVMQAISGRLDGLDDPVERRELFLRLTKLHEEQKEDYVAALETMARLFHEDIGAEAVVRELERLAKVAGAERRLAEIYAHELEQGRIGDASLARLGQRAAELFARFGENERALKFYRSALEFEPDNRGLFAAVDRLLEGMERHAERVALYQSGLDYRYDPGERARMLHVIAELQASKLKQTERAIETYAQILDIDGGDVQALDALTALYREAGRYTDLAGVYLRRAESTEPLEAAAEYRVELSRLCREKLDDTSRAIDQLEEITRYLPRHPTALAELEALRSNPAYRERVVEILRPLYEASDSWRRLISLNEDRSTLTQEVEERVAILCETARLWEDRGNEYEEARQTLARALELQPDNGLVRAEYERLTARVGAWSDLVVVYEALLAQGAVQVDKRDYVASLARVYDKELNDPRSAINAYDRLLQSDPTDLDAVQKLEQLAMLLSDWVTLVQVLEVKVELLLSDADRARVWRQIGEGKRDMLDDAPGAIAAYEQALGLEPSEAFTLDCLIDLYEKAKNPTRLVELYDQRVELTSSEDREQRYALLSAAAGVFETELKDRANAIERLKQALHEKPGDAPVLDHLAQLYRVEEAWPELLDTLERRVAVGSDEALRVELRKEIARTYAERLNNPNEALATYKVVLDTSPSDETAIVAVLGLAQDEEALRYAAARILVPILGASGQHERLIQVLELRLSAETEPTTRLGTLQEIARIKEVELKDEAGALDALLLALSEAPEVLGLHEEIERLAGRSAGFSRYAVALEERAGATFDADLAKDLFVRLGRIAEVRLGDVERAVTAYARAIEQVGDQADLLAVIDRLYVSQGNQVALGEIIERRLAFATSAQEQAGLYLRLASLQEEAFKEPEQALGSLKRALELDPRDEAPLARLEKLGEDPAFFAEASEALEEAYRFSGLTDRLAQLYQRRIDFAESAEQRVDLRRSLARVLEEESADAPAAQRVVSQGLEDAPTDSALLDEIERLATKTGDFAQAAQAIERAVASSSGLLPEAAGSLCLKAAEWYRDRVKDLDSAERVLSKALELDPSSDDVLYQLEGLQRAAGHTGPLIETLRRRGKLQLDPNLREELYRQAVELADADRDGATTEAVLRELLAQDDTSLWALGRLEQLCEQAQNYREVLELLSKRIELRADAQTLAELRHRAAEIARDKLGQGRRAIELYLQLFDDDPGDRRAADALCRLYASEGQWQELRRLLERLIDVAETVAERAKLRLELAQLSLDQFAEVESAIELLQSVLFEDPAHSEAAVRLSRIYESNGWDARLADLLDQQIDAAHARGDLDAELKFRARLGEIYEQRLGDRGKAIEVFESILDRQPEHGVALRTLVRLYRSEEKPFELASYLERLLPLSEPPEAIELTAELAATYQLLADEEQEIAVLERGLVLDPQNKAFRTRLRQAYEERNDWDKLISLLANEVAHTDSVDEKVRLLRLAAAVHSQHRGDPTSAVEFLAAASKLKPDDRALMLELCDAYSASGRSHDAVRVLEQIVESYAGKRNKELSDIHRRLARAYRLEGRVEQALAEFDKALRIEPGNVAVLKEIGSVSLEVGDLKKAQQMYRALLLQKFDNDSPISKAEVFLDLAVIHERLGEQQKAIQMAERAVQADGLFEAAHALLDRLKRA